MRLYGEELKQSWLGESTNRQLGKVKPTALLSSATGLHVAYSWP